MNESANDNSGEKLELDFIPTDEKPVLLTDAAIDAVKKILAEEGEEGDFLRISVKGGGCSGMQYDLNFDSKERMGDVIVDFDDITVVLDSVSAGYLSGTKIDYLSGLSGTGFKFTNPNAKRTCGCGKSWS